MYHYHGLLVVCLLCSLVAKIARKGLHRVVEAFALHSPTCYLTSCLVSLERNFIRLFTPAIHLDLSCGIRAEAPFICVA